MQRDSNGRFVKGHNTPQSTEAKRKIADTCKKKGIGKWMLGRKLPEATREKQSRNNSRYWLGKKRGALSEETKRKQSQSLRGHRVSTATIERIRLLGKGKFADKHPCWKVEKSTSNPLYKALRRTHKYKDWRTSVFSRDGYACVQCGSKSNLEVDHIKPYIVILKENNIKTFDEILKCNEMYDVGNGRTLCNPCHRKTNTWGRRKVEKRL